MPGIDPKVMKHKLATDPSVRPLQQRRMKFAPDRLDAIKEEMKRNPEKCVFAVYGKFPERELRIIATRVSNSVLSVGFLCWHRNGLVVRFLYF